MKAVFRLLGLAGHLLAGALTILLVFSRLAEGERARRLMDWASRLLRLLHVQVEVRGQHPDAQTGGVLLVANHISWLDIHVLHSLLPARFISKAEVRGWPLIGWLAEQTGTVFLVRERKADAARVNQVMAGHLAVGHVLAFFPEGTTSDGHTVGHFYPSLFQPAVDARATLLPVRLRYLDGGGQPSEAAAYYGGTTLLKSLWRVLGRDDIRVVVEFLPLIPYQAGRGRRDLARLCEEAIRWDGKGEAGAGPGKAPESTARPPA